MSDESKSDTTSTATVPVPATRPRTEIAAFDPNNPIALYMNTGIFDQLQRVATMMATSTFVPDHFRAGVVDKKTQQPKDLKTATGDCFLVAAQSFRWGMDPFAVAQDTFVISGKLGYGGKVIGAVVNTHPRVEKELDYSYSGDGDNRKIVAVATLRGVGPRTVEGTVKQWKTDNPKWRDQPDQQLAYRANREWARRWLPEAILGVTAEEDAPTVIDVTPVAATVEVAPPAPAPQGLSGVTEKLKAKQSADKDAPAPAPKDDTPKEACSHKGIADLVRRGLLSKEEPPPLCATCNRVPEPSEIAAMPGPVAK